MYAGRVVETGPVRVGLRGAPASLHQAPAGVAAGDRRRSRGRGADPGRAARPRRRAGNSMLKKTPVRRIEGRGDAIASKFAKVDVETLFDLLKAGRTADNRYRLSKKIDIPFESIDEWLRIADLFRLSGMDTQFTQLLIRAGVSSVSDLGNRNARRCFHAKC